MKNYILFATDHTGSMRSIARPAARDFNSTIASVKEAAIANNQDVIVSHVKIGHGHSAEVFTTIKNASVTALQPIAEVDYRADAPATRLFDAVVEMIRIASETPDAADKDVSFLIMATTDGGDNDSKTSGRELARMIDRLQKTDRWTFAFRVPKGGTQTLTGLGIPAGNIMEWEQSEKGMAQAAVANKEAFTEYMSARSRGVTATKTFYASLKDVTSEDVKAVLEDISSKVNLWPVAQSEHEKDIRSFVESRLNGLPMKKGAAFYQLTKSEDKVQPNKKIAIRDKKTNAIYYGPAARQMLGLPLVSDVRLKPADLGNFDVFIQSTSVNRKMQAGSQLLYWSDVGVGYKEGPSAR